jgi:hypothetical protein
MAGVCIPNIGPRQQRRRLIGGIALLVVATAVGVSLIWLNAPRPWRLLVFLPSWAGALGVFQVTAKTCVALAARGLRNMDSGDEAIDDERELEQIHAQSKQVHIRSIVSAVAVAALFAAIP